VNVNDPAVTLDSKECPANLEDIAEAYSMGTLDKKRAIAFEEHFVVCSHCAMVLQKNRPVR
jgi:hypothetical protein